MYVLKTKFPFARNMSDSMILEILVSADMRISIAVQFSGISTESVRVCPLYSGFRADLRFNAHEMCSLVLQSTVLPTHVSANSANNHSPQNMERQ